MTSFQRPAADGYRYGVAYRTRREHDSFGWALERWNGTGWMLIGCAQSYAAVRELADADEQKRAKNRVLTPAEWTDADERDRWLDEAQ